MEDYPNYKPHSRSDSEKNTGFPVQQKVYVAPKKRNAHSKRNKAKHNKER